MNRMAVDDLREIIRSGENEAVEFEREVPHPEPLARTIAAFANGNGGDILLGVDNGGKIVGTNTEAADMALQRALPLLSIPVDVHPASLLVGGQPVVMLHVEPTSSGPVLAGGEALMRVGSEERPAPLERIATLLRADWPASAESANGYLSRLAGSILRQSHQIEQLRQELSQASSWRRKLPEWLIGGLVGAVLGVLLSAALGL